MVRLMLFETFLKPTHAFTFNGYSIERKDRLDSEKGGLLIMIKHEISYEIVPCPDKLNAKQSKLITKSKK